MILCPRLLLLMTILTCPALAQDDSWVLAEVATVGFDTRSGSPVAILQEKGGGKIVPIWIGLPEGRAIAFALAGIEVPRPQTHDLMGAIVKASDLKLKEVQIYDLKDNTYFARLVGASDPKKKEPPLEIDSRPSDAMALALRLALPIRVASKLLINMPQVDLEFGDPGQQVIRILGFTAVRAGPDAIRTAKFPETTSGLEVISVGESLDGTLQPGDLLLTADGIKLGAPADLIDIVRKKPANAKVVFQVGRGGEILEVSAPILEPVQTPETDRPSGPAETL
jgi:bifunctional DNase/RNase